MAKDKHVLATAVAAPESSRVEKVKEEMKMLFGIEARGVTAVAAASLVVTCTVAVRSLRDDEKDVPPSSEPSPAAALEALIAERKRQLQAERFKVGTRPPMAAQTVTLGALSPPSPAKAPSAPTGTQPPPPAKLPLPRAKLEALQTNARQWGTQTTGASTGAQASAPVPALDQDPDASIDFKAKLDAVANEAKYRIDTMTIERINKASGDS